MLLGISDIDFSHMNVGKFIISSRYFLNSGLYFEMFLFVVQKVLQSFSVLRVISSLCSRNSLRECLSAVKIFLIRLI